MISIYDFYIKRYENLTDSYYSFELAKLYKQAAYLVINTGDLEKFYIAQLYLERAIAIVENVFITSNDFVSLYSEVYYLYSIIFEHRGNIDKAYNICFDAMGSISKKKLTAIAPDSLKRQIYLLTKDAKTIVDINKTSKTTDLFEIFQNKRRLFQLYLLNHDIKSADIIQKELEFIVKLLTPTLDKIYIGMYYKDIAKYYFYKNNIQLSEIYFRRAFDLFNYYKFEGQKNGLVLDNEQYGYKVIDTEEDGEIICIKR